MSDEEAKVEVPTPDTPSGARRVPANPDLPKLRRKTEEKVKIADDKSAAGLDALDAAKEKWSALQEQITDGHIQVEMSVGDTAVHILKKI